MLKNIIKEMKAIDIEKTSRSDLGKELAKYQRELLGKNQSLIILIDGFESSGRADIIKDLIRELDPRFFKVGTFGEANAEERKYPFLWRFVRKFPRVGHVVVFDRSFYYELFSDLSIKKKELDNQIKDLKFFEDLLYNDNTILCKFFLVQSEKAMKKRVQALHNHPDHHFFTDDLDKYQLKHYKEYLDHFDKVLKASSSTMAPWHVVLSDDLKEASRFVLMSVNNMIKIHFQQEKQTPIIYLPEMSEKPVSKLDLNPTVSEEEYDQQLELLQKEAGELLYKLYSQKKSGVIVFEGTDAAGKGGAIKRLTKMMDPRMYEVATTASPTKEEITHHYLWRFYRDLPMEGRLTIFDRSWYGRVMVERLEKFTPLYRTQQAYQEINDFEDSLVDKDRFVLKFLISISKEEQYNRFMARKDDPEKAYKLTDEDWRNHEKYDDYIEVMDEMVNRTSTEYAPWIVISGTDKKYARLQVLKHFIKAAKEILD